MAAREIALDEQAGDLSRVTALRVCVEDGDRSLLELARRWAQSDRGLPVRIAGVAALGDAGEAEDLEWLRAALERPPRGLRPALQGAVKRFEVRLNAGSDRSSI